MQNVFSVSKVDIGVKSLEDIRKEKLAAAKRLLGRLLIGI